jgi:hypothetical protein
MKPREEWHWEFRAFVTAQGNCSVQEWFWRECDEDAKNRIRDRFGYLEKLPNWEWKRPQYAPLEDRISEVRIKDDRIYGYFGPMRMAYTFLHVTANKKVRNDSHGKKRAKDNLARLERQEGTTRKFVFEEESYSETEKGKGSEGKISILPSR